MAAALVALALGCLFGPRGPRDLLALRHQRVELESRRAQLLARNAELGTVVQNLRSNDRYVEHLIRRELGYARPDELVYKFTGPSEDSAKRDDAAR